MTTTILTHEMYAQLAAAGVGPPPHLTTTAQSLAPSLDASPSWNSAMTPILTQQLDPLYHYQQLQQPPHSARPAPPRRQDSSLAPLSSPSSIAHPPPSSPHPRPPSPTTGGAHLQYSTDLRRQQKEQLLALIRPSEPQAEHYFYQEAEERRQAQEHQQQAQQQYLLNMEYSASASAIASSPSPAHPYYPPQAYDGDLRRHSAEDLAHLELAMDGQLYHQLPMGVYPHAPLDLQPEPPLGMIKYESP